MKYAILRWLMPIAAVALLLLAIAQSDIIIGFIAFGVLRSWWKDLMTLYDPEKGVILSRIGRWALLGGIAVQLLVATTPEEYVACAILFVFVWLWKLGKLPGIWQAIREAYQWMKKIEWPESQDAYDDGKEPIVVSHADESKSIPVNVATTVHGKEALRIGQKSNAVQQPSKTPDPKTEEYRVDAEKVLAAFAKRNEEVRALQDALMARLGK